MEILKWILLLGLSLATLVCESWGYELEKSLFEPKGDFILVGYEQQKVIAAPFCTEKPWVGVEGWLRTELYRLSPGAPRPSLITLRREAKKLILSLGGKILHEGKCNSLAPLGDPRARWVVLTATIPWDWGPVVLEVWSWEEGEDLFFRLVSMSPSVFLFH